jgi:excisionase family DNA binding protein
MVKPIRIDLSGNGTFFNFRPTLSTSEAAKALGVSLRTARTYVTTGLLSAVQVGRAYRIRTESVERLLTFGTAAVRKDGNRLECEASTLPERDMDRDRFRAQLMSRMMEADAMHTSYRPPIC